MENGEKVKERPPFLLFAGERGKDVREKGMKNDEVRCRSTSETIFEMRDLKWNADQGIVEVKWNDEWTNTGIVK